MSRRPPAAARLAVALVAALAAAVAVGCGGTTAGPGSTAAPGGTASCAPVTELRLVPEVVRELPHDPEAFTQGLVVADGRLHESTGLVGRSSLRELDLDTGAVLARVAVPGVFAEGLAARADGTLVQLTWTEGVASEWRPVPGGYERIGELRYDGEGWGLTALADGTLAMSDGSDRLAFRDPTTFAVRERVTVTRDGAPTDALNELEWDGRRIWANRWRTDEIVGVDPDCARVDAVVDASSLRRRAEELADGAPIDVLNGIAHLPGTDRHLLTGKLWPVLFEVRFVPAGPA